MCVGDYGAISMSEDARSPASDQELVLKFISPGGIHTAEAIYQEQQAEGRAHALVLHPARDHLESALDLVRQIKTLEREALSDVSQAGWDPRKTLPCLIVMTDPLEDYGDRRLLEERLRDELAEEGAIVIETRSLQGDFESDEARRELLRPALAAFAQSLGQGDAGPKPSDLRSAAFFQDLPEPTPGTEAYGRSPAHVEPPGDTAELEERLRRGFEQYRNANWWDLEY